MKNHICHEFKIIAPNAINKAIPPEWNLMECLDCKKHLYMCTYKFIPKPILEDDLTLTMPSKEKINEYYDTIEKMFKRLNNQN